MAHAVTRKRYFAGMSRNTVFLAFASLFADISTEILYPILPVFLTETLNANGSVVGLVDGIAQAPDATRVARLNQRFPSLLRRALL